MEGSSLEASLSEALQAEVRLVSESKVQSLWAGYGEVVRLELELSKSRKSNSSSANNGRRRVVMKRVRPPSGESGASHERKLKSYEVEAAFYSSPGGAALRFLAQQQHETDTPHVDDCDACFSNDVSTATIPHPIIAKPAEEGGGTFALVLSDMSPRFRAGYGLQSEAEVDGVLEWMASFHACFWGKPPPEGLWEEGSYWHLGTRRDEFDSLQGSKKWRKMWLAAKGIDRRLRGLDVDGNRPQQEAQEGIEQGKAAASPSYQYRTLVHGDAKDANIMFHRRSGGGAATAALYDFQYVGGGYGSRDLAYLFCSSFSSDLLDDKGGGEGEGARALLRRYHQLLTAKLAATAKGAAETETNNPNGDSPEPSPLFPFSVLCDQFDLAITDYVRFMAGWGMWGNDGWACRWADRVLQRLDGGQHLSTEEAYVEAVYREYPL